MLKRSMFKIVVVVSLSFAVLCGAAAPARATVRNPGDPGLSLWSAFVDYFAHFFPGSEAKPGAGTRKITTTPNGGNGGTTNGTCPPGISSCNTGESGSTADPFGKP